MSKISADTVEAKTTNGDLVLQGNGTGVPDLASGTKLNGTALTDTFSTQSPVGANLIINGDMRIAQRGTVSSIGAPSYGGPDRFQVNLSGVANLTLEQNADAPANTQFKNSLRLTVGTGDALGTASDFVLIRTMFEGQDLHQFKKGTTDAQQFTLQFWARSAVTGTHIVRLRDNDNSRNVSASYSIAVADTWEFQTITFPADTTGAFDDDNGRSLIVEFFVGAGTDYTSGTLSEVWAAAANADGAVGQVNAVATTSNIFALTGVKLEVGSTATAFVPDNYATSLAKCRRYYQIIGGAVNAFAFKWYQTTNGYLQQTLTLAAAMRAIPTLTKNGTWNTTNCGQPFFSSSHPGTIWFQSQTTSTGASGLYTDSTDDTVEMDAEL